MTDGRSTEILRDELLSRLPAIWAEDLLPQIQARVRGDGRKIVVLDDDPTGTQTVHSLPVLTAWPVEMLVAELVDESSAFYILTNSRGMSEQQAVALNREIGHHLVEAARRAKREFVVVSRSDSTLRGHFPVEVAALADALGGGFDGWIVLPFFLEGGRYTIGDIHYVDEGGWFVPSGETPFARDSAFGYRSSDLRAWVAERTAGRVRAEDVVSISIDDLRQGGPARVRARLSALKNGTVCIVNAACYRDLEVFTAGLLDAEALGGRYLYRTAASFVRVRAGLGPRAVLAADELDLSSDCGGLIAVGSYVPKTTMQVEMVRASISVTSIEISVEALLDSDRRDAEIRRAAAGADRILWAGDDVLIYTSRKLITVSDATQSLHIGQRVSAGLVAILRRIQARPRYLIAKGGITSSDIATEALGVKRARVLGQILPGVPLWQLGPESRYPGMPYVVFPGNVGGPAALVEVITKFSSKTMNHNGG